MKKSTHFSFSFLLTTLLCVAGINHAWGASYTSGSTTVTVSGTTITITGNGAMADYANSSAINSLWGTAVSSATTLIVKEGVTHIGAYSFYGFSKITSVTVPSSLTSIGQNAFTSCSTMAKIYYAGSPNEWANIDFSNKEAHPFGAISSAGQYYFYGNTSTYTNTLILFPPLAEIKPYTFQRCSIPSGLSIPGTVNTIGTQAFYGIKCSSGEIAINRKVAPSIGTDAFRELGTNRTVYVPSGATGYPTTGTNWSFSLSQKSVSSTYGDGFLWNLSEDGVLTINATGSTKTLSLGAASGYPWRYFRRLVYKVIIKGEITALNNSFAYLYGISEIKLEQETIPTIGTIASSSTTGTSFNSLSNTKDKVTLSITPAQEGNAALNKAPWNNTTYCTIAIKDYCADPTGLTASATGATTATASWSDDRGDTWKYICKPSAQSAPTSSEWASASSTNTKSVTISSLTPATDYTFYLISDCDEAGISEVLSKKFKTDCGVISIPWSYGFEDCANNETPLCWGELHKSGSTNGYVQAATVARSTGSMGLRIAGGRSTGSPKSEVIAVFPEFDEAISNLELSFYYKTDMDVIDPGWGNTIYGKLQLGYVTNPSNAASFVAVGEPLEQKGTFTPRTEGIVMEGAPSGARFAILYTGGENLGFAAIDDITVREKPSCNKPTGVSAGSETADGATISWNANGMSAWKLQVSEGDAASWGEEIAVATNSKVLTGLKANTIYYVRVKADCGGGSVSEWSDNASFTTLCGIINVSAASPWSIDFEGLSNHIVPDCWDNSASTTSSSWGAGYIWGTYQHSGNTMLAMDNSVLNGGTALMNTPEITIPNDGNKYELAFDYANMAIAGNNLKVKISANGGAFEDKGTYYPSGNVSPYPGAFSNAVISLADYSGQTIKIQFFANPTSGTSSEGGAMFVDNVSVHKVSSCAVPTSLSAGNLSANSARISWTAGGSESAWRLQYRADGGDWSAEQAVSGSAQRELTGLSANTEYFVRVKSFCAADDQSGWSDVLSFTTLCAAQSMPFSEEFSSGSELPSCWEATPATGTYRWSAHENSGAYDIQLRTGSSGSAELRMPAVALSEDAILRFEWKNANGANTDLYISADGGSTKTLLPSDLSGVHADWTTKTVDLSAFTGETVLIYFKSNFTTINQYAYLDDVEVIARPCDMIMNIQATPVTGGATVSWSGNVKKLQYRTGSDAWSSIDIASANYAGPQAISGLTAGKTYQVRLLPACLAEDEANWTAPVLFTSLSVESIPYSNDFESETAGEVPFNWSRVSASEFPQVVYGSFAYHDAFGDKGNSIKFYGVNDQTIVLPEFDAALGDLYITFHYRNSNCKMEFGYVGSDGVTFTALETLPNQTGYGEFPYEKDLYGISAAASQLAIRYSEASGASAQAYVDNVSVDYATCSQPVSLSVSDITATGAHISWAASARATETGYQYIRREWSADDPNWASATLVSNSVHEIDLTGLTPNKDYEFYLRSYCGTGSQSSAVKIEFTTLMSDVVFEDEASATDNESRLAGLENKTVNATIKRPLPLNGDYSTICLPFSLSAAQIADPDCPLHGFVIKEFEHSEKNDDVVDLFLRQVTSIEAGKPYFVRFAGAASDNRISPLTFRSVKITCSTPVEAAASGGVQPHGIFNPHALTGGDNETFFLSSGNTLYWPSDNGTIKGFRAYVHIDASSPLGHAIRRGAPVRIREADNSATGVESVQPAEVRCQKVLRNGQIVIIRDGREYNAQGIRLQ